MQHRELQFFTSSSLSCASCLSKYSQASYCLQGDSYEYCCSPYDTSSKCTTNSTTSNVCSPWKTIAGPLIYSYCRGAAAPTTCGVDSLELIATDNQKTVNVGNLPYKVTVSNRENYLSCYYHIAPEKYLYKEGAKIYIQVEKAAHMSIYLLGGNSRTNASYT